MLANTYVYICQIPTFFKVINITDNPFKKLLIDEQAMLKNIEQQIDRASEILLIETPNGRIVFKDIESMGDREKVLTFLLGKYFAVQAKVINDDAYSISVIAREIGRPMTALSGLLKLLEKDDYIVKLPDRRNKINRFKIDVILNMLLAKMKKKS